MQKTKVNFWVQTGIYLHNFYKLIVAANCSRTWIFRGWRQRVTRVAIENESFAAIKVFVYVWSRTVDKLGDYHTQGPYINCLIVSFFCETHFGSSVPSGHCLGGQLSLDWGALLFFHLKKFSHFRLVIRVLGIALSVVLDVILVKDFLDLLYLIVQGLFRRHNSGQPKIANPHSTLGINKKIFWL